MKNYLLLFVSFLIIVFLRPSLAKSAVLTAGIEDNFALPADIASPSSDLLSLFGSMGLEVQGFDLIANVNGGTPNTGVVHTFTDLPHNIIGATIELRVRAGTWPWGTETDGMILSFIDSTTTSYEDAIAYSRTFGPYDGSSVYFPSDPTGLIGSWTLGQEAFISLDLSALPLAGDDTLNLIPQLNRHGFLDINIGDETGVDFMRLNYEVPEPATYYVDANAPPGGDGSSWEDAFNHVQDALSTASSGDQIWVAEGVYRPDEDTDHPDGTGEREATFQLKSGVAIYGGYAGLGASDPNARDVIE